MSGRPRGWGAPSLTATVVTLAALAVFLYFIRLILIPFALAGAAAYILSIAVDFLTARTGLPRTGVASAIFAVFLGLCAVAGVWVYPSLSGEVLKFATDLKGALVETFKGLAEGGQIKLLGGSYTPDELADKTQGRSRVGLVTPRT